MGRITKQPYMDFNGGKALEIRGKKSMNQLQFWSRIGVTQSGGSRYESGRTVPPTVSRLLALAEGSTQIQIKTLHSIGVDLKKLEKALAAHNAAAEEKEAKAAA